jgi:hypothetical protein
MMISERMADLKHILLQNRKGTAVRSGVVFFGGYRTSNAQSQRMAATPFCFTKLCIVLGSRGVDPGPGTT